MSLRPRILAMVAAVSLVAGCTSTSSNDVDVVVPVSSTIAPTDPDDEFGWVRCDGLDCATLAVPVDRADPELGNMNVAVFRRQGIGASNGRTIVLVPDRFHGPDARSLLETASVRLGQEWTAHTLIALDVRGSDGSPPPEGAPSRLSIADIAGDVALLRDRLGTGSVVAMGWGDGASAVAWAVTQEPDLFDSVALDSPTAIHLAPLDRLEKQIADDAEVVNEALAWCASHISCAMNTNVAKSFNAFKTNQRLGLLAPEVTYDVVGAAARFSFAIGDIGEFFRAVSEATDGNPQRLLMLANIVPHSERIAVLCAEVTSDEVEWHRERLSRRNAESTAHFRMGDESTLYEQCDESHPRRPSSVGGIGDGATRVMVVMSEHNPVIGSSLSRSLAVEHGWEMLEVPVFGHLTVGTDVDTTGKVLRFLVD